MCVRVCVVGQGRDSMLLASMLRTLSIIVNAAGPSPITMSLVAALGEVLLMLRNHGEPHVRRSVAYGMFVIFTVTPPEVLLHEIVVVTREAQLWLEFVVGNDPDELCRKLGWSALGTLQQRAKSIAQAPQDEY